MATPEDKNEFPERNGTIKKLRDEGITRDEIDDVGNVNAYVFLGIKGEDGINIPKALILLINSVNIRIRNTITGNNKIISHKEFQKLSLKRLN